MKPRQPTRSVWTRCQCLIDERFGGFPFEALSLERPQNRRMKMTANPPLSGHSAFMCAMTMPGSRAVHRCTH